MTTDAIDRCVAGVLQRVGRNVWAFQRMEALLKFLVANSEIDAPLTSVPHAKIRRVQKYADKTMGNVLNAFLDTVYDEAARAPELEQEVTEAWLTFSLRIEGTEQEVEERKSALRALVSGRNHLVHRMLLPLKQQSPDVCQSLCEELDSQAALIEREITALGKLAEHLVEARRILVEEGLRLMEDGKG